MPRCRQNVCAHLNASIDMMSIEYSKKKKPNSVCLQEIQHEISCRMSISDYLIKPIQRITKYQLLLRVNFGSTKFPSTSTGCTNINIVSLFPPGFSQVHVQSGTRLWRDRGEPQLQYFNLYPAQWRPFRFTPRILKIHFRICERNVFKCCQKGTRQKVFFAVESSLFSRFWMLWTSQVGNKIQLVAEKCPIETASFCYSEDKANSCVGWFKIPGAVWLGYSSTTLYSFFVSTKGQKKGTLGGPGILHPAKRFLSDRPLRAQCTRTSPRWHHTQKLTWRKDTNINNIHFFNSSY